MEVPRISSSYARSDDPSKVQFSNHTHERYELYCFLSGDVDFYIEGNAYRLSPGDLIIIKKAESHAMAVKGPTPYHRLVVHFNESALVYQPGETEQLLKFLNDRPLGRNNIFPAADHPDTHWKHYLHSICNTDSMAQKQLYLTILLQELSRVCVSDPPVYRDAMTDVIAYINDHLTQELTLDLLCREFFISKAQLNRRFKKATGTTVWNYIVTKRLILAKSFLQGGASANAACQQSGFKDYCTFFRAYKNRFGTSPQQDASAQ